MSHIALLGGSFNPPHLGHQMIALWALSTERADEVWLVPCSQHPFGKALAGFEHRVKMCQLAVRTFATERLRVSEVERDLDAKGRTLITVRHLLRTYPKDRFSLVIGSDILAETDSWFRFDEIQTLVDIQVVRRAGHGEGAPPDSPVLPDISSTEIRERIAHGSQVSHLLPAAVLRYIGEHGLYRAGKG